MCTQKSVKFENILKRNSLNEKKTVPIYGCNQKKIRTEALNFPYPITDFQMSVIPYNTTRKATKSVNYILTYYFY